MNKKNTQFFLEYAFIKSKPCLCLSKILVAVFDQDATEQPEKNANRYHTERFGLLKSLKGYKQKWRRGMLFLEEDEFITMN